MIVYEHKAIINTQNQSQRPIFDIMESWKLLSDGSPPNNEEEP